MTIWVDLLYLDNTMLTDAPKPNHCEQKTPAAAARLSPIVRPQWNPVAPEDSTRGPHVTVDDIARNPGPGPTTKTSPCIGKIRYHNEALDGRAAAPR